MDQNEDFKFKELSKLPNIFNTWNSPYKKSS
jgi:hypothetical protein